MRIIKAGFSKTFPYQQFYEKIWLEAELNEGDDERQVLYELKKTAENFFYESKGAAEKQMAEEKILARPEVLIGNIIQDIESCKEIKVLETYKMLVINKPDLQNAYDKKLLELRKERRMEHFIPKKKKPL